MVSRINCFKEGSDSGKSSEESGINSRSAPRRHAKDPQRSAARPGRNPRAHLTQLSHTGDSGGLGRAQVTQWDQGRGGLSPRSPELAGMFSSLTQPGCLQTHHFWEAREDGQGRGFRGSLGMETERNPRLARGHGGQVVQEADGGGRPWLHRSPHSPRIKKSGLWYNFFPNPGNAGYSSRMRVPVQGYLLRIITLTAVGGGWDEEGHDLKPEWRHGHLKINLLINPVQKTQNKTESRQASTIR